MHSDAPVFPRNALLACEGCNDVFINWTRAPTFCRACGATALREISWPTPSAARPRRRLE